MSSVFPFLIQRLNNTSVQLCDVCPTSTAVALTFAALGALITFKKNLSTLRPEPLKHPSEPGSHQLFWDPQHPSKKKKKKEAEPTEATATALD